MNPINRPSNGRNFPTLVTPAEMLHEALKRRGFLTRVDGDTVVLSAGNGERDARDVRSLLEASGVPICYTEQGCRLQVLSPVITGKICAELNRLQVRYGRSHIPHGFDSWRAFTKRNHGLRWNTLSLDRGIAYLVKALSEAGFLVTGGCDGHGRHEPQVYFASSYAAAWFKIAMQDRLASLHLHYKWEVVEPGDSQGSTKLQASLSAAAGRWSLKLIQQDVLVIGDELRRQAESLRAERRSRFKHRSMLAGAERLQHDFTAICEWMGGVL